MSYGVEVAGETTLVGWDEHGLVKPWTEAEAWAVMIRVRRELVAKGATPLPPMRVVELKA